MPTAIIVDAYSTGRQLAPLLRARGFCCHHVQSAQEVPPVFGSGCRLDDFETNIVHDGRTNMQGVADLAARISGLNPDVILAGSEPGVPLADLLASKVGLPCNNPETALARRDKFRMQEALRTAQLRSIASRLIKSALGACEAAADLGFPVVVKPTMSAGAEDVRICSNAEEVEKAACATLGKVNALGTENQTLVVQEFVVGSEYIVNSVSYRGEHRITELFRCRKTRCGNRNLSAVEQLVPIVGIEEADVCAYALSVLDALGVREGPSHQELVYTETGPCLMELAARMQGAVDPDALVACTGTSHPHLTIEAIVAPHNFLKRPPLPPPPWSKLLRVIFLTNLTGRLTGIPGLASLQAMPSYFSHALGVTVGGDITATCDFVSAPGYAHLVHTSASQLASDYKAFRRLEESGFFAIA